MATSFSPAGAALFGGDTSLMDGLSVADQVANETEEERKKRLLAQQARAGMGDTRPGALGGGYSNALSPAGSTLFGF